ncbi:MAG: HAD-IA family hydrolase [Actinobacteria bacterium]|nr:HAD-IA family hydrolase [Actinomycetota bacterium]
MSEVVLITTVLLDLDGVVRHFDTEYVSRIEAAAGLADGAILAAAFETDLLHSVITGRITRADWTLEVGRRINNAGAAQDWLAAPAVVDDEVMLVVDQLRDCGVTVAVLTNGTDTIPAEMIELGLADRFDAIFSTSDIGFAKPDRRAFEYACDRLDVHPARVFFTDDSESKLSGALEIGMQANHFVGVETFKVQLRDFGLL